MIQQFFVTVKAVSFSLYFLSLISHILAIKQDRYDILVTYTQSSDNSNKYCHVSVWSLTFSRWFWVYIYFKRVEENRLEFCSFLWNSHFRLQEDRHSIYLCEIPTFQNYIFIISWSRSHFIQPSDVRLDFDSQTLKIINKRQKNDPNAIIIIYFFCSKFWYFGSKWQCQI